MKKIFISLLCALSLFACSDDEKTGTEGVDYLADLVGQWVYDHPEEGVWETLKFTSSGKFYFSNTNDLVFEFGNNTVNGSYFINGADVYGNYQLNGASLVLDMTIQDMKPYEFTARFKDTGLIFTYARQIDKRTLDIDETFTPEYELLLHDARIIGYSSHDERIVTVDVRSGAIRAEAVGITYVDVITDRGTAVVAVSVEDADNLFPDYSPALNMNREQVIAEWGDDYTYNGPDGISYNVSGSKYARSVYIYMQNDATYLVQLNLETAYVDDAAREKTVHEYLSRKYAYQENRDGNYFYFDLSQPDVLPMVIGYSPASNVVQYMKVEEEPVEDLWPDYTEEFGKHVEELTAKYGAPFYESETDAYYLVTNDYIDFVAFSFNAGGTYAVVAFLKEAADWQAALDYLGKKYYPYEKGTAPSDGLYAFTNESSLETSSVGITFDGKNGCVTYVDLTANRSAAAVTERKAAPRLEAQGVSKKLPAPFLLRNRGVALKKR